MYVCILVYECVCYIIDEERACLNVHVMFTHTYLPGNATCYCWAGLQVLIETCGRLHTGTYICCISLSVCLVCKWVHIFGVPVLVVDVYVCMYVFGSPGTGSVIDYVNRLLNFVRTLIFLSPERGPTCWLVLVFFLNSFF